MRVHVAALMLAMLCVLTADPLSAAPPVLVVYPFAVAAPAAPALGAELAKQISADLTSLSGINVIEGNAQPTDYRSSARSAGADAYLMGSIVQVGSNYLAIEELVSARTGILIWSRSLQFRTVAEALGSARAIHDQLVPPTPAPALAQTPKAIVHASPSAAPHPTSSATPVPIVIQKSAPGAFAVLPVTGPARDDERSYAANAIVVALHLLGLEAVPVSESGDLKTRAAALCNATSAIGLVAANLSTKHEPGLPIRYTATLGLRGYNCKTSVLDPDFGTTSATTEHDAESIRDAINGSVLLLPSVYVQRH